MLFLSPLLEVFSPPRVFSSKLSIEFGIDGQTILTLIGLGVLSTACYCYTMAAQRLPVVMTTAILLLEPVFATLFASVALREIPSLWFYIGSASSLWITVNC